MQVLTCRHRSSSRVSAVVKFVPDPRKMRVETNSCSTESSDALYLFTVTQEERRAVDNGQGSGGGYADPRIRPNVVWAIETVKVVPVQFVNAWPKRR
jgi:hypothetical protein